MLARRDAAPLPASSLSPGTLHLLSPCATNTPTASTFPCPSLSCPGSSICPPASLRIRMDPGHRGAGPSFYTSVPSSIPSSPAPERLHIYSVPGPTLASLGIRPELPGKMSGRAGTRDYLHPCPVQLAWVLQVCTKVWGPPPRLPQAPDDILETQNPSQHDFKTKAGAGTRASFTTVLPCPPHSPSPPCSQGGALGGGQWLGI